MKNMFKRMFCILLVLTMSFGMSVQAFAQEVYSHETTVSLSNDKASVESTTGIWGAETTGEGWQHGTFNV